MRLSSTVDNIVAAWSAGTRNSMESTQESGSQWAQTGGQADIDK